VNEEKFFKFILILFCFFQSKFQGKSQFQYLEKVLFCRTNSSKVLIPSTGINTCGMVPGKVWKYNSIYIYTIYNYTRYQVYQVYIYIYIYIPVVCTRTKFELVWGVWGVEFSSEIKFLGMKTNPQQKISKKKL
jgi:hypothetical protein